MTWLKIKIDNMPNYKMPMKMYGSGKNPIMLTKEAQTKIMASDANPNFKKAIADSPATKKRCGCKGACKCGKTMAKKYGHKK
tara:strand:+ start:853 stop:1098 length:246 start_codon:yes stop_codon:yes gene_type:complete